MARWAKGLYPPAGPLPPELAALVAELRQLPNPKAQVMAALQWVQNQIRYFSVSLGESSHRPHSPQELLQTRYGDCKHKSYLLVTLLRELGIEAHPVLLSFQARAVPARLLPTPQLFDHAIVQAVIGGQTYYLDGTRLGQAGLLDHQDAGLQGAQVLVVDPSTQALSEVNAPNALEAATFSLSESFKLGAFDGEATLDVTETWNGNRAESLRVLTPRWSDEQKRRLVSAGYERRLFAHFSGIQHWPA